MKEVLVLLLLSAHLLAVTRSFNVEILQQRDRFLSFDKWLRLKRIKKKHVIERVRKMKPISRLWPWPFFAARFIVPPSRIGLIDERRPTRVVWNFSRARVPADTDAHSTVCVRY